MTIDELSNDISFLIKCTNLNWYCIRGDNKKQIDKLKKILTRTKKFVSEKDCIEFLKTIHPIDSPEDLRVGGDSIWK